MKKNTLLLLMLLFNLMLSGQVKYKKYENINIGVSLEYPSSWESIVNPKVAFIFMRPLDQIGQVFRENINLVLTPSGGYSLGEYVKASKSQLTRYLTNYREVSSKDIIVDGVPAVKIIYTHSLNSLDLYVVCYILLKGGQGYNFTCSALQTTSLKYEPIFKEVMNSCKFIK